jgi:hypothetical protein
MSVEIKKEKDEFSPPEPIQVNGDKKLWIIDGYRVWAKTYAEAVQLAIMIDGF